MQTDTKQISSTVTFEDPLIIHELVGNMSENLSKIEQKLDLSIDFRGNNFLLLSSSGKTIKLCETLLIKLYDLIDKGYHLNVDDVSYSIRMLKTNPEVNLNRIFLNKIVLKKNKKTISPKSMAQHNYVDALRRSDMVFAVGPAGTGKTYLAIAMAISSLMNKEYKKLILCRPAVEAGERLGFLPGTLEEKINPYLRPLYDALNEMGDPENTRRMIENDIIEIAPLAFMRGRTLNSSFIIMDEAQNTSVEQMKMFLTRMGNNSKVVVTGDITQTDLPPDKVSGLSSAIHILKDIKEISICRFSQLDVVRHELVQKIITAYERH